MDLLEERLASLISDSIVPRLVPELEIIPWRRTHVVAVQMHPSGARPHYMKRDGPERGVYIRVGSTNRHADGELIEELRRFARGEAFDEQPMPAATRMVLPFYALKHQLGMEGKTPEQIADGIQAAYARGQLPRRDTVSFGYMWSADQQLGPGMGHWHPHMMIFAPYYDNAMLGGNDVGVAPIVSDDAGTPFTVIVIPVDDKLAIKPQQK